MGRGTKRPRTNSGSPSLNSTAPKSLSLASDINSTIEQVEPASHKSKKLKLLSSYAVDSPFPGFEHPTALEAQQVYDLLLEHSHRQAPPVMKVPNASNNSATTCGGVPNVIDSLIGTILSQNTSGRNSTAAKHGLDAAFGKHNFQAMAEAPREEVVEAIKHGGLANRKAATIQKILSAIKTKHGVYSLQHLAADGTDNVASSSAQRMSDQDVMTELVSYDGVGPKTAACVLMFCLGRESFAVDTHVFRLSKILGWVPPKADRVLAQAHLDLKIPGELKYGLHMMMIQHGRACKGCKVKGKGECALKVHVRERGMTKKSVAGAQIVKFN